MKRTIISISLLLIVAMVACKKNDTSSAAISGTTIQAEAAALQAVAIDVSSRHAGDSVYVINTCKAKERLNTIEFTSLPETATNYLSANYQDYVEVKAYSVSDTAGTITGYLAVIKVDETPIAIKFDASGNFVKVLEQREGRDMDNKHHNNGNKYPKNTITIDSLPENIRSYLNSNYPSDTLLYAFVKKNGNYIVLSKNQGLYATTFTSSGDFISHNSVSDHKEKLTPVEASALPAVISSYLETTYPGYSIEKSFSVSNSSGTAGYLVLIEVNNNKYGLAFDASGNFLKVKMIR